MAGESAEQLARRQRERAERLMRSADRYERGAQGERTTGAILDGLRSEGWIVFHDVRWPGRARANLDHVAVGPGGVFVVDSKNWSGRVEVRENTFWCHGRRQDRTVAAAGDAALAVAGAVSAPAAAAVRSALCFVRDEPVAGWCYDVMVCSTANLREMLLTRPPVLTPDQVRLAGIELDLGFKAAASARTVYAPVSRAPRPPRHPVSPRPVVRTRKRAWPGGRRRRRRVMPGIAGLLGLGLAAILALNLLPALAQSLAREFVDNIAPVTAYENCRAIRKDYPDGVGTAAAVEGLDRTRRLPETSDRVYEANASLDKDDDGLVCERKNGP